MDKTHETVSKTITVTVDGESYELKMTYGLLNELLDKVRDLTGVSFFFTDPDIRNAALRSLLSIRDARGKVTEVRNFDDVVVEEEDIESLLTWASLHVTGFFIRSLTTMANQLAKIQTLSDPSPSLETGSKS